MKRTIMLISVLLLVFTSMSASAVALIYSVTMSGPNEDPANASPGIGSGTVTFDPDLVTMNVDVTFSGLTGTVSAAHIHCCTADAGVGNVGVASSVPSFPGFPSNVTEGTYNQTFDLTLASSFNPAFVTNNGGTVESAFDALFAGVQSGKAYFNIHTNQFPGGEIRGFLQPVPVPAALWLMGSAIIGLLGTNRISRIR